MDKSDLALILGALSLVTSIMSAAYSRKLARNDTERMKRKPLVVELSSHGIDAPKGWDAKLITIRNLEPVRANLLEIHALPKTAQIASRQITADSLPKLEIAPIGENRSMYIGFPIGPVGENTARLGTANIAHLYVYTKNIESPTELKLIWQWADGQPV